MKDYAPRAAPAFSPPPPGTDPGRHTSLENDRAYQAFLERKQFKEALCAIMDSDEIFRLAPREARKRLLDLRELLRNLPDEGIAT
jgi:hypothetical protein